MSGPKLIPNQWPQWLQIAYQSLDSEYTSIAYSTVLKQIFLSGTTLDSGVTFTISGTSLLKPITSSKSAFVVCLDANSGSYVWHSWILGSGDQIPTTILLTNSDTEILVSGSSTTTDTTSFSISEGSVVKPPTTGVASFLINLSATDGSYNWSSWIDGTGDEYIRDMRLASDGSIYTVGNSTTTGLSIDIGGASQTKPATTATAGFLVQWTSAGTYVYSQWFYGNNNVICRSCKVDEGTGDVIVCGDTITADTSFTIAGTLVAKPITLYVSAFVIRLLGVDGTYIWDRWIYNSQNLYGTFVGIDSITSSIYFAGRTNETGPNFYVSEISIEKPVTTNYSGIIIRFESNGTYSTSTCIDGPDFDYITELTISQSILYIMGSSSSSGTFFSVSRSQIQKPETQNSAGFIIALNLQSFNYLYGLWINGTANEYNRGFNVQNDMLYFTGISNSTESQLTEGEYTLAKPLTSANFGYVSQYRIDSLVFLRNTQLINATVRKATLYHVSGSRGSTPNFGLAEVITAAITGITSASAVSGGTVLVDKGNFVTARGVCWNTTGNPTIANSRTTNGTGLGSFVSNITTLSVGTTYYVRAYATNSVGTGGLTYGDEKQFITAQTAPNVTTNSATIISGGSTTVTCTINSTGSATVTTRGICWDTSPNPTIALATKTVESGSFSTGTFTSTATGISANTVYIRAYATNSLGTSSYGGEITAISTPAWVDSTLLFFLPFNGDASAPASYTDAGPNINNFPRLGGSLITIGGRIGYNGTGQGGNVLLLNLAINSVTNATYSCWVYLLTAPSDTRGVIFSRSNSNSGVCGINFNGSSLHHHWNDNYYGQSSAVVPPLRTWTYIAVVITPTASFWYQNGTLVETKSQNYSLANLSNVYIGNDNPAVARDRDFNGYIDDPMFARRAYSSSEIATIYTNSITDHTGLPF